MKMNLEVKLQKENLYLFVIVEMFLVLSFERFINYELLIMISCSFIGNGKLVVIKFKSIVVG